VQLQSGDAVWARIEALARAQPGGVVATDADGTLWEGDVGEDLFHAFLEFGRVEPPATAAIRKDARDHDVSDAGTGAEVARRIYGAYLRGGFPEERICELMTWCFAGWTRAEVAAFARRVVDAESIGARFHGEMISMLARARAAGIEVVLVSASPVAIVQEAASSAGFDAEHVVAAQASYLGEVMAAHVERPIPYAGGKLTRLRERIGAPRQLYAAFGDNAFDTDLLCGAGVPVAVRPKPQLRALASAVPGIVELMR
jgi:phosphoserine phosphatase